MDLLVIASIALLSVSALTTTIRFIDWFTTAEPQRVLALLKHSVSAFALLLALAAIAFLYFKWYVAAAAFAGGSALAALAPHLPRLSRLVRRLFARPWTFRPFRFGQSRGVPAKTGAPTDRETGRIGLSAPYQLSSDRELVAHAAAVLESYVAHQRALADFRASIARPDESGAATDQTAEGCSDTRSGASDANASALSATTADGAHHPSSQALEKARALIAATSSSTVPGSRDLGERAERDEGPAIEPLSTHATTKNAAGRTAPS